MKKFLAYILKVIWNFLAEEKMPVWLSLVLVAIGGYSTYYIAPVINEKFEMQAARREFLVKNLDQFSGDVKSLFDLVASGLNSSTKYELEKVKIEVNPVVAKIQFSATQINFLIPRNAALVVKFQRSLNSLQDDMISHSFGQDSSEIRSDMREMTDLSMQVYRALLRRAGLSADEIDANLQSQ
jgi:hypothetical protein